MICIFFPYREIIKLEENNWPPQLTFPFYIFFWFYYPQSRWYTFIFIALLLLLLFNLLNLIF